MAIWARQMQGLVPLQPEQLAADDALGTVTEDDEVRCMLQDSVRKKKRSLVKTTSERRWLRESSV
jgi:hypothetical protein